MLGFSGRRKRRDREAVQRNGEVSGFSAAFILCGLCVQCFSRVD
jgi:hypothetical protein